MTADIIMINASVFTADKNRSTQQAVTGTKIVYVGTDSGAEAFVGPDMNVIDPHGGSVLPGMIDVHNHLLVSAQFLSYQVCFNGSMTIDEYLGTLEQFIKVHPDMEKYAGIGYVPEKFPSNIPRKELLDKVCPDKPV